MTRKNKTPKGSITIMAIFIFLIIISTISLTLQFAVLQNQITKNQLQKIQNRYAVEDSIYEFVYDDRNIDEYIKGKIFDIYRVEAVTDGQIYPIKFKDEDIFKEKIQNAYFKIDNINKRKNIIFHMDYKYKDVGVSLIASGPFIGEVFELDKSLLVEAELSEAEKDLFTKFLDKMQAENCDYDCKLNSRAIKINSSKDMTLELKEPTSLKNKINSKKKFVADLDGVNERSTAFTLQSLIVNLKRDKDGDRTLTVGSLEDLETIKMYGVLYIEGDLIINQDFEFLGLIVINGGNIRVDPDKDFKVEGMIFYRGENLEAENINVVYKQDIIYKEASFLPGFIEIDIDTIKKY